MNCHDIARILDEHDVALLPAEEHDAVAKHLNTCKGCASAWKAHERVLGAAIPEVPAGLAARCRTLAAASASLRPRRGSGPVVIGSFLFVAVAAAAAVGWNLTIQDQDTGSETAMADPEALNGIGVSNADVAAVTSGPVRTLPAEGGDSAADSDAAGSADDLLSVAVTFAHRATNPDARRLAESVHAIVLEELRALPHLRIVEIEAEDEPPPATPASSLPPPIQAVQVEAAELGSMADIVLVAPPGVPSGEIPAALRERIEDIEAGTTVGGASATYLTDDLSAAESGIVNVLLSNNVTGVRVDLHTSTSGVPDAPIEPEFDYQLDIRSGGAGDRWSLDMQVTAQSTRAEGGFTSSTGSSTAASVDPRELVDHLIATLRETVFPDESLLAEYRGIALDSSLSVDQRLQALNRMRGVEERFARAGRSESVLRAATSMVASAGDRERAEIWRAVRGARDPVLVAPLRNAVLYESSEAVRLEAVISLAEYADDDPSARAMLVFVASQPDVSPSLKLHAQWGALDDAGRRALVISRLTDTSLPVAERVALLEFSPDWSVGNAMTIDLGASVDQRVADSLAEMVTTTADAAERRSVLGALSAIRHPALAALYIERLGNDPEASLRHTAALSLARYVNEPGVRPALERALAGDTSSQVRDTAARVLSQPQ